MKMSRNKSQLDVYRIDRLAVLTELKDSIDESSYLRMQEISQNMDNFAEISEEDVLYYSSMIIEFIVGQQNNKQKGLKFKSIALEPALYRSYKLVLYEAYSEPTSAVKMLVNDQLIGRTRKNTNVSYVLFLINQRNIFSFCSGSGWQTIKPYADPLFGLHILSHLVSASASCINTVHYRGFTGTIATQRTSFRRNARTNEIIDFGQLCRDLSGRISVERAKEALGIQSSPKRKNVGADFKSSFKLKKRMNLSEFCDLLDKITDLLNSEPYFNVEDVLGITPIGDSSKEKKLKKELLDEVLGKFYTNSLNKDPDDEDVFISDSNISDYMSAGVYRLSYNSHSTSVDEFSCGAHLKEYIDYIISKYQGNSAEMQQYVVNSLKETNIESFGENENDPPLTSGKLVNCIQLNLVYRSRNYIFLEGKWYVVYEGLTDKLNAGLPALIKERFSPIKLPQWRDMDEDTYIDLLSLHHNHAKMHRLRPLNNIELCDTILFSDNRLIFLHIKDGFDTSMRVLTAQVQSSAELLTDVILTNRLDELKAKWNALSYIKNIPGWSIIEDAILGKYRIVECLVMNPGIDIAKDVSSINSTIAKYELSTLIRVY